MHRLVSIAISHYCEKVRWALQWAGEPFVEQAHVPLLHWPFSLGAGGGRTVPVLVTQDGDILADSTDILLWLSQRHPSLHLFGRTPDDQKEIRRLEAHFDRHLGPATRRWGYYHLLPNKDATIQYVAQQVSPAERLLFRLTLPLSGRLMRRGLKINAAGEARSRQKIKQIFHEVSELVADGRPFLVGPTLSAADLTFASLASVVLQPSEHPVPFLPLAMQPAAVQSLVTALRQTPAGVYGLGLYQYFRKSRTPSSDVSANG